MLFSMFLIFIFPIAIIINGSNGMKTWLPPRDAQAKIVRGYDGAETLVFESETQGIWEIGQGLIWHKSLGHAARDVTAEYMEVPPGYIREKMKRIRESSGGGTSANGSIRPTASGSIRPAGDEPSGSIRPREPSGSIRPSVGEPSGSIRSIESTATAERGPVKTPQRQGSIRTTPTLTSGSIRTTPTSGSIRTLPTGAKKIWEAPPDAEAKIVRGPDHVDTILFESPTEGTWEIGNGEIWHKPNGRSARNVTTQFEPIHTAYIQDQMVRLRKSGRTAGSIRMPDASFDSIRPFYEQQKSGSSGSIRPQQQGVQRGSIRPEGSQQQKSAPFGVTDSGRPPLQNFGSIRTTATGSIRTLESSTGDGGSIRTMEKPFPSTGSIRITEQQQQQQPYHRRSHSSDVNNNRSELHLKAGKTIRPGDDVPVGGDNIRLYPGEIVEDSSQYAGTSASAHYSRSIRPSADAAGASGGTDLLRITENQLIGLGIVDEDGYAPNHHEFVPEEAADIHRSIRDDPKYIKRKPVHNYLRVFFDYFPTPLLADPDSVDSYINKMTKCSYTNNRRSFRADIGGGFQLGKFSLGQLTSDNELLNYVAKQFNQLEAEKGLTDWVKAMLAVWTLFSMTSEILTVMHQRNSWAYCDCSKCERENAEIRRKITSINSGDGQQQFDLKVVAENAQLVADIVQDKIAKYDPNDDWIHAFMLRHRGNSIRDKIKNMMRSLSIRAQRLPSPMGSLRRSFSGRHGRGFC